ncbi:hypothetical protein [Acinetobacter indicus]|uniref:hypothetical protein n=1 Tax=Acinetobacter indicus TaxID=756892 RepID=UPI002578E6C7|nr:hypothetical protein [Acinetobacter indicus]MDM1329696.1 hypothetical protein [Acinetobacter indicus]MDM1338087.1 hypothetical protein [Acinetobacter indicus]
MYSKLLGAGLITGLMSATAFAEPPIQPGDTLESLSKAKVVTTVNGQPGSLQDIVASGQVRIVSEANPQVVQPMPTNPQLDVIPADAPAQVPGHDAPVQAVAPDASALTSQPVPAGQSTDPLAQGAQPITEPPAAELTAPTAEAAQNAAPMMDSSAEAPVNGIEAETDVTQEALAAAPEAAPMADPAIQAAPEAGAEQMQAPVQALPEAPSLNEAN